MHCAASGSGASATCNVAGPFGCQLNLAPGPLHLDVSSGGRALAAEILLPPQGADLKLSYHHATMGYIGLGVIGEGLLDELAAGLVAVAASNTTQASSPFAGDQLQNKNLLTADAIAFGVIGGAAILTGAILALIGFHRAGPQIDVQPLGSNDPPPQMIYPPPSESQSSPGTASSAPAPAPATGWK